MTRIVLVLLCLVLVLLAVLGMRRGWRNRMRSQAHLPSLPAAPADLGAPLTEPITGLYVGTTFARSWQDRVVHEGLGLRAAATATLHRAGVRIEREGASTVFIPADLVTGARLAPGLAGKVVGAGGLLVISWRLGEALLDTALRADAPATYLEWLSAIGPAIPTSTPVTGVERQFGVQSE